MKIYNPIGGIFKEMDALFNFIGSIFGYVLDFFNNIFGNFGVSIIFFTHVSADDQAAEEYGWYAAFAAENEGIAGKIWQ